MLEQSGGGPLKRLSDSLVKRVAALQGHTAVDSVVRSVNCLVAGASVILAKRADGGQIFE